MTSATPLTLYTINMSHYSEKIRWLLDHEQINYRECPLTPAVHALPMLFKGKRGQTTVPLVERSGGADNARVQDSPRIVAWLADEYGPLNSLPEVHREEIIAIQQRFDRIGKPVARYLYLPGFAHDDLVKNIWTQFAKGWEEMIVRLFYPVIKPVFKVKLKINKKDVARAEQQIDDEIKWLEEKLSSASGDSTRVRYLVGDQLTVADITAASILAPLACPKEHPIYGAKDFREKMAGPAEKWAGSPALEWVRDIYAEHRGRIWKQTPINR